MKHIVVVACVAASVVASTARAQVPHVGMRGGVNLSSFAGHNAGDFDWTTRALAGGVVVVDANDRLAVQMEFLWSSKGADGKGPLPDDTYSASVALDYLEIPLLVRFVPVSGERMRPFVYAGPGLAINLSADATMGGPSGDPSTTDIKDRVRDFDMMLFAGAGVAVALGQPTVEIDARYSMGLNTLTDSLSGLDLRNQTWAFSIALLFDVGNQH